LTFIIDAESFFDKFWLDKIFYFQNKDIERIAIILLITTLRLCAFA